MDDVDNVDVVVDVVVSDCCCGTSTITCVEGDDEGEFDNDDEVDEGFGDEFKLLRLFDVVAIVTGIDMLLLLMLLLLTLLSLPLTMLELKLFVRWPAFGRSNASGG